MRRLAVGYSLLTVLVVVFFLHLNTDPCGLSAETNNVINEKLEALADSKSPPRHLIPQNSYKKFPYPAVVEIPLKTSWIPAVIHGDHTTKMSLVTQPTRPKRNSSTTF